MKWALGAVALIAVIAVAVAVTLAFSRGGGHDGGTHGGGGKGSDTRSGIASADDTGPVAVITDEPTCAKFEPINDGLADQQHNGWDKRDPAIPSVDWTPDQRAQYEAVGNALRNAADQYVTLAKQTPNRVVRELYGQFTAYARAYVNAIPNYRAENDVSIRIAADASSTLYYLCKAISLGSASVWGPSVSKGTAPPHPDVPVDAAHPVEFMSTRDHVCGDLISADDQFGVEVEVWDNLDHSIPATAWNSDQKSVYSTVGPVMSNYANSLEKFANKSDNATTQDFLMLAVQYLRAYVSSIGTYIPADSFLSATANLVTAVVVQACKASEG